MPESTESKAAKTDKDIEKICIHCGKRKKLDNFYPNRGWKEQLCKDIWCKDCVNKLSTKDEMREFFWENNRNWDEQMWKAAKVAAEQTALTSSAYTHAGAERKEKILEALTCRQVVSIMNKTYYRFTDNTKDGRVASYKEAKAGGLISETDDDIKIYNKKFNGHFKKNELEYLESYYQRLEKEFDFEDVNTEDFAKKLCKASLMADKAQDDYAAGKIDSRVLNDAMAQFDMLSKSANFAPSKRNKEDAGSISSWSELTYKLETSGHPCTRKIEWPEDDVDRTINEFKHIVEALSLDSQ